MRFVSRRGGRKALALVTWIAALIVAACSGQAAIGGRIGEWMSCDECTEHERGAVAALGNFAVTGLESILRAPPTGRIEHVRRQIIESYQPGTGMTLEAYVALMLDAYTAKRQTRAAISLGDIGSSAAQAALARAEAEADLHRYRSDVLRVIRGARARAGAPRFTGTVTPRNANFGDTVRVRAGSLQWTANTSVVLNASPFGDQVFQQRFTGLANTATDDSLKFVAVGEIGQYVLSISGQGPNNVTQVDTTLRVLSMRYEVHTTATAEVIPQAALPQTRYMVLGTRGNSDTLDFFKVAGGAPATVTATARWPGAGDVQLGWRDCSGGFPGGTTAGGRVVAGTGAGIGGAQVSIPGFGVSSVTTPAGAFSVVFPPAAVTGGLVRLDVRRIGYSPRTFRVAAGTAGNVLSLTSSGATTATTMSTRSAATAVGPGVCRLLQVWTSPTGRHRMVQLRIGT